MKLTVNMRLLAQAAHMSPEHLHRTQQFAQWLLDVGDGIVNTNDDNIALPPGTPIHPIPSSFTITFLSMHIDICLPPSDNSVKQLIEHVYPDITEVQTLPDNERQIYFSERAILAPLNKNVDEVNDQCVERLTGESRTYLSVDSAIDESNNPDHTIPLEYLNCIKLSGMPVHSITLKVGCPIILLRNLNPSAGLCNGTRLIVVSLKSRVIEARILTGVHAGDQAFIPRLTLMTTPSSSSLPFRLRRRQFPIRIAFGMSINKSQGQSLRIIGVLLTTPVFTHGQFYVGLSRAIDREHVYISLSPTCPTTSTINIVFREMLCRDINNR